MIYLDNAATSYPKAPGVAEAVLRALSEPLGNPGRTTHSPGREADKILFETRELLASFFNISDSSKFVFTTNATEALNTVLRGFSGLKKGTALTSSLEHNSVMRPLRSLSENIGTKILMFRSLEGSGGYPDLNDFEEKIKKNRPSLIVTTGASNVTGVIFPIKEMCLLAREYGIPVCIDGAQLTGEVPLDLSDISPDFFCFSGHKGLLGPSGTGGLYIADSSLVAPLKTGGTGSLSSKDEHPDFMPDKYESGTPNFTGLTGLREALLFWEKENIEECAAKKEFLCRRLISGLRENEYLFPLGDREKFPPTSVVSLGIRRKEGAFLSKSIPANSLSELTGILDREGVAVRTGFHCAPSAHRSLGTLVDGGTIRISPGVFNSEKEIDFVLNLLSF